MNARELIDTIIKNQEEMKKQLGFIESVLRKKFVGIDGVPLEMEETGYITVNDLSRLGAITKVGKDGKEYVWIEKTDISKVLNNAKKYDILEETRDSLLYLIDKSTKNAEKYMSEEYKEATIQKLSEKRKECAEFEK